MPTPRLLYRALKYRYRNDRQELRLLKNALPSGGVAVDVGAHKGAYLYWLKYWAGPAGEVYAFEPQAPLTAYLAREFAACPQVQIHGAAVSSVHGATVRLVLPDNAPGPSPGARVEPAGGLVLASSEVIPTITLDEWFATRRPPQVIKCDCEGHELDVFHGAKQLLSAYHPALLFECEARHRDARGIQPVFDFLFSLSYAGWRIDRDGLQPFCGAQPPPARPGEGNNYWFCQAGSQDAIAPGRP